MKELNFVEVESRSSLDEYMRKSFQQYVLLGKRAEAPNRFYSLEFDVPNQTIGLGVLSSGTGIKPSAFFTNSRIVLVGYNCCVSAVNVTSGEELFCAPFLGVFYCFLPDQVSDSILVLHELGLFRLLLDGRIQWNVNTGIVEDSRQEEHLVTLKIMDEDEVTVVDTTTGATLA